MGIGIAAGSSVQPATGLASKRLDALSQQLRKGSLSPGGLAEFHELTANHGPRAAALARKDVDLRAHGKSLDAGEAAELLHLQAGIDPNHARMGAQFAKTGSLPSQSALSYFSTVNGAQPQRASERVALSLLQEHLRQSKPGAKDAKPPRWENLTVNEVDLLEQKSVMDAMKQLSDGLSAIAEMPRNPNIRPLRAADDVPANAPGPEAPVARAAQEPREWASPKRARDPLALPQVQRIWRP